MISTIACCSKKSLFLSFGLAVFAVFFIFVYSSHSQETNFDKEKALRIMAENGGPGGCGSEASCGEFCDDPNNFEACVNWARSNGVIVSEENFEKHSRVIREGGPGGCGSPQECRAFCEQPRNHGVCIDHAVQQGFMTEEEAQKIKEFQTRADEFRKRSEEFRRQAVEQRRPEAREVDPGFDEEKAKQVLSAQGGPGGCTTFDECGEFCDNPDNQSACFEFAEQNGLFKDKEEAEKIKRIMREGGPGGCRGEKECHQFCENEANFEVCISFAEKSGLMPPEEIEQAKKGIQAMKEGGPGGCKTREACEKVCQDPANQQACFEWAKKHGLMSDEELRFIEESQKMREQFESKRQQFEGEFRPPEGFGPPAGTGEFGSGNNAEECVKYGGSWDGSRCDFGVSECAKQGGNWDGKTCNFPGSEGGPPPGSGISPVGPPVGEYRGPGGCRTTEECQKYCETHSQECYGATPSGGGPEYQAKPLESLPILNADQSYEECQRQGGDLIGGKCDFGRRECASQGGIWDGSRCNFKEQSPSSLSTHPFLGAIYRFLLK